MQKAPDRSLWDYLVRSHHALAALAALLLGASNTNLHAATFSDHNWTGMGGYPGANDPVNATVVDASGNLYIAGGFTIAGDVLANHIAKWDGTNWSALGSGVNGGVSALAVSGHALYVAGSFTTAGGIAANNIAKWNGTWSALGLGITGDYVYSLAVSGNDVYASGTFTNAGGNSVNNIAKWNGANWSALGSGLQGNGGSWTYVNALAVSDNDLYAGGQFTTAGGVAIANIARWNGGGWSSLGSGVQGTDYWGNPYANVSALAVSGNDLYVAGYFSTAGGIPATNMAKWNGSSWSSLPWPLHDANEQVLGASVNSLMVSGNDLYAAGVADTDISSSSYYGYVVKWNGSSWSPLGTGMSGPWYDAWDPSVSTVAVLGTNVFAGGAFTRAGDSGANCLAKWNGSEWSAINSSAGQNSVFRMAASSTHVYAAGSFKGADGVVSNYVGRWNGIGWSPLGSGMIDQVYALAASGSDLYAGGAFTNAAGISANRIAKWNGSSWSALGSGMNGSVFALAVSGNELYAAGYFTTAGGVAATNIAKWNGTNWVALGWPGLPSSPVNALVVSGSDLYAGCDFVAKWNGSTWSALGSGDRPVHVHALAVMGGDLYAGGDFTMNGITIKCVAKWDGANWSVLDSGMTRDDRGPRGDGESNHTPHVYTLAVSGNHLYVGGYFNTAGDADANYIAKWDGSSWSALGSGMSYGVRSLAVSSDELFAAGDFTLAGGKLATDLARARIGSRVQTLNASNSTATIRFSGVTGYEYDVQRTTSLTPPVTWSTVSDVPLYPAADGSFTFTDTNTPPGTAFYRAYLSGPGL